MEVSSNLIVITDPFKDSPVRLGRAIAVFREFSAAITGGSFFMDMMFQP